MTVAADQFSDSTLGALSQMIESHTGIRLPPSKRSMVEGRLRKRVRSLGFDGLDDYTACVLGPRPADGELVELINCITTNKTDFFREPSHFTFLQQVAIPAVLRVQTRSPVRIKVWSAACSIGAEAYSIAMVLQDMQGPRFDFRYSILGTDISTDVLEEARTAIYPKAMMDPVPADKRLRYTMAPKDDASDEVRITPELRRTTQFERLNLMDHQYPVDTDVDVIFCRNVLIYFDRPTQQAVIERLASHLRPGGYLLLGHSESMAGNDAKLRQVQPTVFQSDPPHHPRAA